MKRLQPDTLCGVHPDVQLPRYDRSALKPGIVHLGLGAFHRAHQAVFTEDAIAASGGDWGIIGVSMRSDTVARQLRPQQNLYSLMSRDASEHTLRVVGVLCEVLVAPQQPERVVAAIASSATRVITLTITEKAYQVPAGGCSPDRAASTMAGDLPIPALRQSAIGLLAQGLQRRQREHGAPLSIISCDNLAENSARLRAVLQDYLANCPDVLAWMDRSVAFPCSMVDRIVPAMSEAQRVRQARLLGLRDEAAVITEPFSQWIIENTFATPIPDWQGVGVQLVDDIRPYEEIKLRLLNASHSAIAYSGLLAGKDTVDQVMADPLLGDFIGQLMERELAVVLEVPPSFDLQRYREALLARFANPYLGHRCDQIAMDGSEKISQRWLPTLQANPACPLLLKALSCWVYFVLKTDLSISDPRAEQLLLWRNSAGPQLKSVQGVLACARIEPAACPDFEPLCARIVSNLSLLAGGGVAALLADLQEYIAFPGSHGHEA